MNKGRSDASTSTDDVKGRPLCLFYFTHPFGVLSPEPPTLAAAPPDIARAFINMEPVSPFQFWTSTSTEESYKTTSSVSTRPSYDLGKATVHKSPVNLVSVTNTRKCTVDFGSRRDSFASTLFSSDVWFNSSSSSRSNDYARRVVPYNTILPPLQLPNNLSDLDDSDDVWPRKFLVPGKFSLPPIEMPDSKSSEVLESEEAILPCQSVRTESVSTAREQRRRRRLGVNKLRRRRYSDVRRLLACLMRRAIRVSTGSDGSVKARATRTARTPQLEPQPAELCTLDAPARRRTAAAEPAPRRHLRPPWSHIIPLGEGRGPTASAPSSSTASLVTGGAAAEVRTAVVRAVAYTFIQVEKETHHQHCSDCWPPSGTRGLSPPRSSTAARR